VRDVMMLLSRGENTGSKFDDYSFAPAGMQHKAGSSIKVTHL